MKKILIIAALAIGTFASAQAQSTIDSLSKATGVDYAQKYLDTNPTIAEEITGNDTCYCIPCPKCNIYLSADSLQRGHKGFYRFSTMQVANDTLMPQSLRDSCSNAAGKGKAYYELVFTSWFNKQTYIQNPAPNIINYINE